MAAITGKTGVNGKRAKEEHGQAERDARRLTAVENVLMKEALRKRGRVDAGKIAAARALYDKLKPTLAAVEQTTINEMDGVPEEQLLAAIQSLVAQRPELVDTLVALRDAQRQAEANAGASSTAAQ